MSTPRDSHKLMRKSSSAPFSSSEEEVHQSTDTDCLMKGEPTCSSLVTRKSPVCGKDEEDRSQCDSLSLTNSIIGSSPDDDEELIDNEWQGIVSEPATTNTPASDNSVERTPTTVSDVTVLPVRPTLNTFSFAGNPLNDFDDLMTLMPAVSASAKPLTRADKVRHVLVLGATGNIGRLVLKALGAMERATTLTINCLVRANKPEVAIARVRASVSSLRLGPEATTRLMGLVRVWCGDVTKEMFGMNEAEYLRLVRRVEGVYVAVGPDIRAELHKFHLGQSSKTDSPLSCQNSLYSSMSETLVTHWQHIFRFAAADKAKHIWAVSPLLASLQLLLAPTTGQPLVESQLDSLAALSDSNLSPHTNLFGCLAWAKCVTEGALAAAKRDKGVSVTIFRLAPLSLGNPIERGKLHPENSALTWSFLQLMVRTGIAPDLPPDFYTLLSQSGEQCLQHAVNLSLSHNRLHWIYHIIRTEPQVTGSSLIETLKELGIFLTLKPLSVFCESVSKLSGVEPCITIAVDDLMRLGRWESKLEKITGISTAHFEQDCISVNPPTFFNPLLQVKAGSRALLLRHYFLPDSLGTLTCVDAAVAEAIRVSGGLSDFGSDWLQLVHSGWGRILEELHREGSATFVAKAICARRLVVYLTTLLYMQEKERLCPEILLEPLENPVVLVGLNRAGITVLHRMLSADYSLNRCPTALEMWFPYGPRGDYQPRGLDRNDPEAWALDPRKTAADDLIRLQLWETRSEAVSDSAHAEEDAVPFEMMGRSYSICTSFGLPEYSQWLMEDHAKEMKKCYTLHKRLFQHLQFQRPGKRWIFKMPWHIFGLDRILSVYPSAEIVILHRKPCSALQPYCNLELSLQSSYMVGLGPNMAQTIGHRVLADMSDAISFALELQEEMALTFVKSHPALQPPQSFFINLYFDEFIAHPTGAVFILYQRLARTPPIASVEKAMWDSLQSTGPVSSRVRLRRDLSNFGLSRDMVKQKFDAYDTMYFSASERLRRKQEYSLASAIRQNSVDPEKLFDTHGSILMSGPTWLERTGLVSSANNVNVMLSYARTRFVSPPTN